jgi:hypothetical protein
LVRDNSTKYNTIENDLSKIACDVCNEFEAKVLSSEELSQIITEEEFTRLLDDSQNQVENRRVPTVRLRLHQGSNAPTSENQASNESTYSLRDRGRTRRQSSLESLPLPGAASIRRRVLRNEFEATSSSQRRSTRSRDPTPVTEVLGRTSRSRSGALGSEHRDNQASENPEGNDANGDVADLNESEDDRKPSAHSSVSSNNYEEEQGYSSDEDADQTLDQAESKIPARRSQRQVKRSAAVEDSSHGEGEDEPENYAVGQASRGRARATRSSSSPRETQALSKKRQRTRGISRARGESGRESGLSESEDSEGESAISDEDEEDDDNSVGYQARSPVRRKRASSSVRQQQAVRTSPRSKRKMKFALPEDSPTRRSSRSCARHHSSYTEFPSDFEPEEEESDDSVEEASMPKNGSRRATSKIEQLPSDFEDEEELSEEEETSRRHSSKKRRQGKGKSCTAFSA